MSDFDEDDRRTRIRQARQVLAGDAIRPSPDPWVAGGGALGMSPLQRNYLIVLTVLLILGLVIAYVLGAGVASVILFVLALGLIAAWLVF
jgi:Flp pilus assembly protein TadB